MSVVGFSEKTCECGCDNLLPLSLMHKPGRRFLYGHKPKTAAAAVPVGDGARRKPRPGAVQQVGYDAMRQLVEQNIAAVMARRQEIDEEVATLAQDLEGMDVQLAAVNKDLAELDALREALAPFCAGQSEGAA